MRPCALALVLVFAFGCETTLEGDLSESQADEILVALHVDGIGATKETTGTGADARHSIMVSPDDVGRSLQVIRAADLPRRNAPGLGEAFSEGSLVPTATEERARYVSALGSDLATSLERMDGVLDARVHVALPEPRDFAIDEAAPRPRASVLLKHRQGTPVDENAVRALIAGAVQEMIVDDVAVVQVAATPAPESAGASLVKLGPITVTRSSSNSLKGILIGAVALNVLLALLLVWSVTRRRRPVATELAEPAA